MPLKFDKYVVAIFFFFGIAVGASGSSDLSVRYSLVMAYVAIGLQFCTLLLMLRRDKRAKGVF